MVASMKDLGIDRLSVEDRLQLVHEIWDSIAAESNATLQPAQQEELRRRLAEHDQNPEDVVAWEQIRAEAMKRFQ